MILNIIINHWLLDIGLSKLYDNMINNFHITTNDNRLNQKIDEALHEALNGYPYTTVRYVDHDIIIKIATIHLLSQNIEPTESDISYMCDLLETIKLGKKNTSNGMNKMLYYYHE